MSDHKNLFDIEKDQEKALIIASEIFHAGKIFIYPTDTIYGIGGNPFHLGVVNRIVELKGRQEKKKFIWLVSDIEKLINYVDITEEKHLQFLQKIWPGPVSVILNLNKRTKEITLQDTVAIRIPGNDFCLNLLREISRPLISTSVNRSGGEPLNHIDQMIKNFASDVDAIFYHQESIEEKSSTIIDLTSKQPKLIREGAIKFVELLHNFS
jgi:L-threonylcarbamoyladenylate synthase